MVWVEEKQDVENLENLEAARSKGYTKGFRRLVKCIQSALLEIYGLQIEQPAYALMLKFKQWAAVPQRILFRGTSDNQQRNQSNRQPGERKTQLLIYTDTAETESRYRLFKKDSVQARRTKEILHGVGARSIGNISRNLCRMTVYYVRQQRNGWLNSSNIHVSSEN